MRWHVVPGDEKWFVALGGTSERPSHVHPIGFDSERDAARGAARLNERDHKERVE